MKAKRKKSNIFKVMEKKNQPRILYSANIFFKNKAKTKTFSDKTKGKKKSLPAGLNCKKHYRYRRTAPPHDTSMTFWSLYGPLSQGLTTI